MKGEYKYSCSQIKMEIKQKNSYLLNMFIPIRYKYENKDEFLVKT